MGRESPGEVLRILIESPLAEPRGSLRGAAAPMLDLFDRCAFLALLLPPPAAQGLVIPLCPLHQFRELMGRGANGRGFMIRLCRIIAFRAVGGQSRNAVCVAARFDVRR